MSPSSRIPPLLQPCIRLPKDKSILLVTSTLGASANWLIIRFICDALSSTAKDGGLSDEINTLGEGGVNIILVSWMQEWEFWKQEARKGGGLDLDRAKREGRMAFVDGLRALFLPDGGEKNENIPVTKTTQTPPVRTLPGGIPARGPAAVPARTTPSASTIPARNLPEQTSASTKQGHYTLCSPDLAHLKSTIQTAVAHLTPTSTSTTTTKTLLILDTPSILLATTPTISPSSLTSLVLTLHTTLPHILVHSHADDPLLSLSTPPQPLELAHHNFVVKVAHMSRRVLSVRVLDTGVARDVSGVLRVTENKVGLGDLRVKGKEEEEDDGNGGREVLYYVKGDGSVRVFERGGGGDG
ncbi:hypothetical protein BDV95DRAFT_671396 [Massariosphaeria phaeospora]|uniref:Elongator complex protein 5 n=1 Tax=Massariosphaeria phaeospora TaxID=100035 RepID=A0A7C8M477_9PLEO|nr:hypothetical protein BDV95DRAFT_671396 [Massariosphaeria phaeospora]